MYLYGIRRNNYYKATLKPNIIGFTYNKNNSIVTRLLSSINNMLGESSISTLVANNYSTKKFNYLANSKISKNSLTYDYSSLISDLINLLDR